MNKKKLLLVSPTKFELNNFLINYKTEQVSEHLVQFETDNLIIDYSEIGIGKLNTALNSYRLLQNKKYDFAVLAGIAGSFNKQIQLSETVLVNHEFDMDLYAEDGENIIEMSALNIPGISNDMTKGIENKIITDTSTKSVRAISSDTIHGNENSIKIILNRYYNLFNCYPDIESMEGYAFFKVCKELNIPFLEVRCISNYVEKRNKANWKINEALEKLNMYLIVLLKQF